jgi:hypothetical protein
MMREKMSFSEKIKIQTRAAGMQLSKDHIETIPMHPDDFEAQLAWIMAKRFHEMIVKETSPEKTGNCRIIG